MATSTENILTRQKNKNGIKYLKYSCTVNKSIIKLNCVQGLPAASHHIAACALHIY